MNSWKKDKKFTKPLTRYEKIFDNFGNKNSVNI